MEGVGILSAACKAGALFTAPDAPTSPHNGEESLPGSRHCVDLREKGTGGTHLGRHFAGASVLGRAGQWGTRATCAPRLGPLETIFLTCTPSASERVLGKQESERLWRQKWWGDTRSTWGPGI